MAHFIQVDTFLGLLGMHCSGVHPRLALEARVPRVVRARAALLELLGPSSLESPSCTSPSLAQDWLNLEVKAG